MFSARRPDIRMRTVSNRGLGAEGLNVTSIRGLAAMFDLEAYSLRAAKRATFAAYALALDGGETPRESFAAAVSAWLRFRPGAGTFEAYENVMPVVLAAHDLDEADRRLLPALTG
jgi:hypothetical protein